MATTPVNTPPPAPSIDQLVKQLVKRVDVNKDGQISTEEFGGFLTELIRGASGTKSVTGDPLKQLAPRAVQEGEQTAEDDPAVDEVADVDPSTWTDNNAPYGVTFAGWSPQQHRHLTLADLGVPGKAEKYAVYNYLLSNRIQPTNDWAPAAAEALNRKYQTTVYRAIDGETLGFGNEYVHSAPNGYGMRWGTYNPAATGEFFWGWV